VNIAFGLTQHLKQLRTVETRV